MREMLIILKEKAVTTKTHSDNFFLNSQILVLQTMAAVATCVLHYVTGRFSARVQEICSLRTTGRLVRKVSWSLS